MQAWLDAPSPQLEDISDAGLEMLSDLHFGMQPAEQPLVDLHAMQVTTSDALALRQALLKKANLTTQKTKMLIQAVIGPETNRKLKRVSAHPFNNKATARAHATAFHSDL